MCAALVVSGAVFCIIAIKGGGSAERGVLEVRDADSGRLRGTWPLAESGGFAIEFIHSVNMSPVRETFRVREGWLVLESVRFYAFGAGVQSDLGEGQVLTRDGDAMVISGFNGALREINLMVGTVPDHVLFINNEIVNLQEHFGKNARITLRYR